MIIIRTRGGTGKGKPYWYFLMARKLSVAYGVAAWAGIAWASQAQQGWAITAAGEPLHEFWGLVKGHIHLSSPPSPFFLCASLLSFCLSSLSPPPPTRTQLEL